MTDYESSEPLKIDIYHCTLGRTYISMWSFDALLCVHVTWKSHMKFQANRRIFCLATFGLKIDALNAGFPSVLFTSF